MHTACSSDSGGGGPPYRDPLEGTWDQGQRPPRSNMGPGRQIGRDIILNPPPPR